MVPRTASKGGSKVDQYGRKIKEKNSIDNKETAELKEFYDANNSKEKKKSGEKKYDSRLEYLNLISRGEIDVDTEESEEEKETDDDNDQNVDSDDEVDNKEGWIVFVRTVINYRLLKGKYLFRQSTWPAFLSHSG